MKKVILLLAVLMAYMTSFGQKKRADTIAALIDGNSTMEKIFVIKGFKKNKKNRKIDTKTNIVREKSEDDTIGVFIRYDSLNGTNYLVDIYISPNNSSLTPGTDINVGIGGGLDAGIVVFSIDSLKSSNGKLQIACKRNKDFDNLVSVKIYYAPRDKANMTYVLFRKLLSVAPPKG